MTYKEIITYLQTIPPPVALVKLYPEAQGEDEGSRYYAQGINKSTLEKLMVFIDNGLVRKIKDLSFKGRKNSKLKELVSKITKGKMTLMEKVVAIHQWVFENVEYRETPYLVPPWDLVEPGVSGDCKSFACLISSFLGILGVPNWFKLVSFRDLNVPRHIYNMAYLSWEPVDGTGAYPFCEVKGVTGYLLYEVDKTAIFPPRMALTEEAVPLLPPALNYVKVPFPLLIFGGIIVAGLAGALAIK